MAESFKFELVSPERMLISAEVEEVIVSGSEGDFTVLPHHAPLVATLRLGILRVPRMDNEFAEIYVRSGIADVSPEGALTILAEKAVPLKELNATVYAAELKVIEDDLANAIDEDAKANAAYTLERLRGLRETFGVAA